MKYITKTLDYKTTGPSAITLGKFDGLHRGHELLLTRLKEIAGQENLTSVVFTFDIPPRRLSENLASQQIMTNLEKCERLSSEGIDILYECPFTPEVMSMEPVDFISWIVEKFQVRHIVVGTDFGFGHKRSGNYETLLQYADQFGYSVHVIDKMQEHGRDISSTYIREAIEAGDIPLANELLGYPYFTIGKIIHGKQIGRTIGIPTINMAFPKEKMLPPFGVYITEVELDGRVYGGVSNIGKKPTIEGEHPVGLETYILDFSGDVYGQKAIVRFQKHLRPEMKFNSIDELKGQMNQDIQTARNYFQN